MLHRFVFSILMRLRSFSGLAGALLVCVTVQAAEPVRIGVLAVRPKLQTQAQWQPLAVALKKAIPNRDFLIEALTYPELEDAVASRQLDFALTNPGHYVKLSRRGGLAAPLATLLVEESGLSTAVFGGVIFSRTDRVSLNTLNDIKGKTISVVGNDSLGGYQMQALELKQSGVELPHDVKLLETGMPHDKVVEDVLTGRADVGFVRTGVLEALTREGKLDMKLVKVLNRQNLPDFPVVTSTPLYPEWPFAYLPHTDEDLARHVAAALFLLHENPETILAMGIRGFAVSADYSPVADLLRELRAPPFEVAPSFTLRDVGSRYRWPLFVGLVALGLILMLALRLLLARRNLASQHRLVLLQTQQLQDSETRYRTLIEWTPEPILVHRQGTILYVNAAAVKLFGAPSALALMQKSTHELIHPDSREAQAQRMKNIIDKVDIVPFVESRFLKLDGAPIDVEVQGTAIVYDGESAIHVSVRDITERKQAVEKLKFAASVFTHAREGITITNASGMIIDVNDAFTRITGYPREEVMGKNPRLLSSGLQSKEFYIAMWDDLKTKGHWYGEIWNKRKNGQIYPEMLTISAVCDQQGNAEHYVALFSDITALKAHEEQLEHIAHFDALTNLPNRVLLADRLRQGMTQALRRNQRLAVAYLDLDGFKAINDQHGHAAGDQLLMAVASRMKLALREGDTLARLGGDEFVAVLIDLDDVAASVPMLSRLLAAAAQPVQVGDLVLQVSASLGVTFYPQADDVDADLLLRQSDQAMYQAKMAGKNRYHVFDAELDRNLRGHHESVLRIRQALVADEFVLYYQPKVNMRTGAVIGVEALIRWQHPEQGLLPPAAFLPVIEDHPLAIDIGEWVINTALTQMMLWEAQGLNVPVSVNVSARQLQQSSFVLRLRDILAAHSGVNPASLSLEVLETSALEDLALVSQIIEECRRMGVTFALDDFGTGYSSLTYLKRLPVTLLKIDQSFVRDMLDDPDDLAILEGVMGLAKAFHREVIAEGVETVPHGTLLLQLGCELAQGYGIARPMPSSDLPGWVATWRPDPAWVAIG
ncbi:EAL domain-containing protein [Rhodoferax sp.]|uniref:EAL domain-containing protein n=1 Tax=Rhodoferax sp. TaxID=50421 RepID=UPI00301B4806